jgi:hypothetical protein
MLSNHPTIEPYFIKPIGAFGKVHQNPVEGFGNVRVNLFKIGDAIVKHDI